MFPFSSFLHKVTSIKLLSLLNFKLGLMKISLSGIVVIL